MPNTESARKRVRQSVKRNALNNWRRRNMKEQVKAFLKAVHDRDLAAAETEYRKTVSVLDKTAGSKTIHRNTASRRKSRLAKRLEALKQGAKA